MGRSAAGDHAAEAMEAIASIMRDDTAPQMARLAAARTILDRAWGRPSSEEHTGGNDALSTLSDAELAALIRKLDAALAGGA